MQLRCLHSLQPLSAQDSTPRSDSSCNTHSSSFPVGVQLTPPRGWCSSPKQHSFLNVSCAPAYILLIVQVCFIFLIVFFFLKLGNINLILLNHLCHFTQATKELFSVDIKFYLPSREPTSFFLQYLLAQPVVY